MERQKRAKARGAADPAPLAPEARARLESQVAGVVAALETEVEPAALQDAGQLPIPRTLTGTPTSWRPWGP